MIELLIVVAIIALLLSILLPSLRVAREQAKQIQCGSNLRELGIAFHMYASDYSGKAMPLAYSDQSPPVYWWGTSAADRIDRSAGMTAPYLQCELRTSSVYECPAQPWGSYEHMQGAADSISSTYGYNGYYLSPAQTPGWSWDIGRRPWQNLDLLSYPQRLFVFADAMLSWDDGLKNTALLDPPMLFSRYGHTWRRNGSPTTSFRHRGKTVAVHADGHADALLPGDGVITDREHRIGSVGAANDPHYVPDWRDW